MSLLTGAARSASVTPLVDSKLFEIDRENLAPILQDRPRYSSA
jgi:CRP-like cAMP-binding protein